MLIHHRRLIGILAFLLLSALVETAPCLESQAKKQQPWPPPTPSPKGNPTTPAKIELGKRLFFDPRLSGNNKMSCATCHLPEKAFADGRIHGKGQDGKKLSRNTPSLLNVGYLSALFLDGRAKSLEEQALEPIQSADEMNQKLDELETELSAIPDYVRRFRTVFGTPVNRQGIANALAAFQRTLVSGPSPYDRYLAGDKTALSKQAKRGMELFFGDAGCSDCHNGPLLSDGKFHRIGHAFNDKGRELISGKKEDRYRFRTSPLRNVAQTAPYGHDGSMKTLNDVVTFYYRYVPKRGPDGLLIDAQALTGNGFSEVADVVAFLEALSGEVPKVKPPTLP